MKRIITLLLITLILFGITGCTSSNKPELREKGNFQIDEETRSEILSFFENNKDLNKINDYCIENKGECFYYCREINPTYEFCTNLTEMRERKPTIPNSNEK